MTRHPSTEARVAVLRGALAHYVDQADKCDVAWWRHGDELARREYFEHRENIRRVTAEIRELESAAAEKRSVF